MARSGCVHVCAQCNLIFSDSQWSWGGKKETWCTYTLLESWSTSGCSGCSFRPRRTCTFSFGLKLDGAMVNLYITVCLFNQPTSWARFSRTQLCMQELVRDVGPEPSLNPNNEIKAAGGAIGAAVAFGRVWKQDFQRFKANNVRAGDFGARARIPSNLLFF